MELNIKQGFKKSFLLLSSFLLALPNVLAVDNVFIIEVSQTNILVLIVFTLIAVALSFLNLGKTINLFGSLMIILSGFIIMFNIQFLIGVMVLILGIISASSVE